MKVDRFNLEAAIQAAWSTKEDLDLIYSDVGDGDPSVDDTCNALLGLIHLHDLRMSELWGIFCQMVSEGQFVIKDDTDE